MVDSPEIRTERLCLVPFQERHLSVRYLGWLNDRELMRYSEQRHKTHSLATCWAYWHSFAGTPNYFWAIEERREGLGHIGNMNAYVDLANQLADLGIVIGERAAKGKGYGLEAWLAVCSVLFQKGTIRKMTAGTLAVNMPMIKLMERAGMVKDGVRTRQYLVDGQEVDLIYGALFRNDWLKRRESTGSLRNY